MDQKTYDVGMKMRRQVAGNEYVDKAMANVDDFNRDFQRIVTQYCWGEAWGDDTLPPRERSILNLGMIASLGRMEEFQTHVRGALNNGMTPNEIRAVLIQIAVYCGIPVRRRLLPPRQADHRGVAEEQEVAPCSISPTSAAPRQDQRPRARLPAASRGAGSGRAGDAHRPADRQGHRAASAGALAVRRRHARGQAPRVPVHQRGRRQRQEIRHAGRGRRAVGQPGNLRHRHGQAGRGDRPAPGSTPWRIRFRRCASLPRRARRSSSRATS